ncbi:hypothetical protein EIN_341130 [Entamoeba invadens IP1]|uniref:C2 domain-containing protein n=1 Tax=Entamoeba invadens IP1 TaxID=370355 RepID=A0A0A1UDR6_ENTIV|nr:hypothetical protein EIN_341130 [Entamoeba invadens IP1]ELP94745.1 hypothetical protein EIN_341130 [Entamoeba invadens IP1]|eukprot:XP_004261516.1 hypothetical protein EIN_341130 [Entamoeba invadens IP1]
MSLDHQLSDSSPQAGDYIFDIVVEKGRNLPKADVAQRIDGFVVLSFSVSQKCKKNGGELSDEEDQKKTYVMSTRQRSCQTKAILNTYNPVWDSRFLLHHLATGDITIELFDWDRVSANDFIGDKKVNVVDLASGFINFPVPLDLQEEYLEQRVDNQQPTEIYFSFGKILTFDYVVKTVEEDTKKFAGIIDRPKNRTTMKPMKGPLLQDHSDNHKMKGDKIAKIEKIEKAEKVEKKEKPEKSEKTDEEKTKDEKIEAEIAEEDENEFYIHHKEKEIVRSLKSVGIEGAYFGIKYNENNTVDFTVMSRDKNCVLYISSEEGFNKKFLVTVTRDDEYFSVLGKKVKYSFVMAKVPLCNPLSFFSLRKLKEAEVLTLDQITTKRGWKGKMSYYQATLTLQDSFFIDMDERILMNEKDFILGVKDHVKTSELVIYPKQSSKIWMGLFDHQTPNEILMFDKNRKFDEIEDTITSKIFVQKEFPVIHKDVTLRLFDEDPSFESIFLVDLIPFLV